MQTDTGWAICFVVSLWDMLFGGILQIAGIIFLEYQDLFNEGATAVAWVGFSMGICLMFTAPIGGYITDRLSHQMLRVYIAVLVLLASSSIAVSSVMPNLPLTVFTFGICFGLFAGICDPSVLYLVTIYFIEKRTLAYSIIFLGTPIGSIILPLMFAATIEHYGFRGTMLIFAALWLNTLIIPFSAWPLDVEKCTVDKDVNIPLEDVNERGNPQHPQISIISPANIIPADVTPNTEENRVSSQCEGSDTGDMASQVTSNNNNNNNSRSVWLKLTEIFVSYGNFFASPGLPFLLTSIFMGFLAYTIAYFIIPSVALQLEMSKLEASIILTVASVAEMVSRILIGILVDQCHVSRAAVLLTTYALFGLMALVTVVFMNPYTLYGYGVAAGGFGGSVIGLSIPMMTDVAGDKKNGAAMGVFSLSYALVSAIVPLIHGALYDSFGTYKNSLYVSATASLLGIIVYFGTRICRSRIKMYDVNQ